jgi:hypothetical protein
MMLARIRSPTMDAKVARGMRVGALFATVCSWRKLAAVAASSVEALFAPVMSNS